MARIWSELDRVAVDKTMIRPNDEQCWLFPVVDLKTNELLHTKLETATTMVFTHSFQMKVDEKYDVSDIPRNRRFLVCERDAERLVNAVFLIDGSRSLQDACQRHGLDFRHENMQIGMPSNYTWRYKTAYLLFHKPFL